MFIPHRGACVRDMCVNMYMYMYVRVYVYAGSVFRKCITRFLQVYMIHLSNNISFFPLPGHLRTLYMYTYVYAYISLYIQIQIHTIKYKD